MTVIQERYTPEQRAAVAHAYEDRKIRPAKLVVAMAATGELEHEGAKLDSFVITQDYVRDLARDLRKRRSGQRTSQLAELPPRDAIENLRRRLVNAADAMLADLERSKPSVMDPERHRQISRAVKEAAAIPARDDPRPAAPGAKQDGKREGGETKGGLAGQILKAHRSATDGATTPSGQAATPPAEYTNHNTGSDDARTTPTGAADDETTQIDDEPGSDVRALAARHGVQLAG